VRETDRDRERLAERESAQGIPESDGGGGAGERWRRGGGRDLQKTYLHTAHVVTAPAQPGRNSENSVP